MRMRSLQTTVTALIILGGLQANAQDPSVFDRSLLKKLGAGYAALINFAENPDIATARYYVDGENGSDAVIHVLRLSGNHDFHLKDRIWHPFVQVHVPYQTLKQRTDLDLGTDNDAIDAEWDAYGLSMVSGLTFPITTNLSISPALALGYVRLENKADYYGNAAPLQPFMDGIILNWTADAILYGGSLSLDYERPFKKYDLNLRGSATHNLIETFHSDSGYVEFSSYVTTLSLLGEAVIPTRVHFSRYPISVVPMLGGTSFVGPYRDELGFSYFANAGLAAEVDISERGWIIRKLRLGGKGIYGEEVWGWSLIFSYKF